MTNRTLELVGPVAPQHRLDEAAFGHGQSNPTYLLEVSSAHHGSPPARFVLRKKPPGDLLKSAHAVEREFQVLAALGSPAAGATVPVPAVHALCTDPSVIGTPFYIMDFVPGRIFTDPCLPDLPPAARTQIYTAMAGTLAALHSARLPQLQKDGFGRPDSYCRRQVERWAKQYETSVKSIGEEFREEDVKMRGLIAWLRENVPGEDAAADGVMRGVVHGDFRLDNLVFHPTEPRVVAVLDWELSTLGNQMSDVAYCCLPYHLPPSQPGAMLPSLGITQLPGGPPAEALPAGIPSEAQFVHAYCHEIQRLQGVSLWPGDTWRFYVALSLFRGAAIFTGIYQRALQGNASSSRAGQAGRQVAGLIACALHVVHSPSSIPSLPPPPPPAAAAAAAAAQGSSSSSSIGGSSGAGGSAGSWDGSSAVPVSPSHPVGLAPSPRAEALRRRVAEFVTQEVLPIEGILEAHAVSEARWTIHPLVERLKGKAKQAGLWNLWIPALDGGVPVPVTPVLRDCQSRGLLGAGLSNLDYAHVCKEMGKSVWAPELFNCSAPDTGNMEVGFSAMECGSVGWDEVECGGVWRSAVQCGGRGCAAGGGAIESGLCARVQGDGQERWGGMRLSAVECGGVRFSAVGGGVLLGAGLSNLDYAHVCKEMGKSVWAPELFNCSTPDTGNMEVLLRYGNEQQQREWLVPLLEGKIRSCFAMTEPRVASSDATNIEARIESTGDHYILHGHKWWASGASDPRCQLAIFMGKHPQRAAPSGPLSAPAHRQQSMLLVPMGAPGVTVVRPLLVFGYDDAPHGHSEVLFEGVRVPKTNVLLGEGRGFEIAQGRLGPGRLHHCMRLIGATERAMHCMLQRALSRVAFGRPLGGNESVVRDTAECRITLEAARLLVLQAAAELDAKGNKEARIAIAMAKVRGSRAKGNKEARIAIAMAKVAAPRAAQKVLDRAIQVHGGGGVSSDFPLARLWTAARTLRIADGPDEVHLASIGKKELRDWQRKMMMRDGRSGSSELEAEGGMGGVSSDFPLARLWTATRTLRIADGPDEVHLASIGKKELRVWQRKMMMRGGRSGSSGGVAGGASSRL
ncbi:unnamed protein product [Closterium sp. Naga37s-1]|nr:unnamed protein product [Closterium sp. Naga37s-1]